jgi:hypothetical protein
MRSMTFTTLKFPIIDLFNSIMTITISIKIANEPSEVSPDPELSKQVIRDLHSARLSEILKFSWATREPDLRLGSARLVRPTLSQTIHFSYCLKYIDISLHTSVGFRDRASI